MKPDPPGTAATPAPLSRRGLLTRAPLAVGAWALAGSSRGSVHSNSGPGHGNSAPRRQRNALQLESFVDPLYLPPTLQPVTGSTGPSRSAQGTPLYRVDMRESMHKLHRDLPPTRMLTYNGGPVGPLFDVQANQPIQVQWSNHLPARHFLPLDYTLHGSGRDVPESRAIVHLHGGRTPADSDGWPESWYPNGQSRTFRYPNTQPAATLWYHDHAMGISRLNLYAGLAGMYLLRDTAEERLGLPSGSFELPLLLCDRLFDTDGQLFYPVSGDPEHPWTESFEGDAMMVNGRVQPFHVVEPRTYRLRLVNAANSRFFLLSLSNGAPFLQIGSDQGLLPQAVTLQQLSIAPGERFDVLVDFSGAANSSVVLQNGPAALMQFRVRPATATTVPFATASRAPIADGAPLVPMDRLRLAPGIHVRELTLNEFDQPDGRPMIMLLNRTPWHAPLTESVRLGSTEIWSFLNLTGDTHPIHLHHVRFQVLDRQPFDRDLYVLQNTLRITGEPLPRHPAESGWKDIVQCPPGLVTRIIVRFEGHPGRYIWHCHLQEHEANDMMRPYEILA